MPFLHYFTEIAIVFYKITIVSGHEKMYKLDTCINSIILSIQLMHSG